MKALVVQWPSKNEALSSKPNTLQGKKEKKINE
jgi:hypothetical protein